MFEDSERVWRMINRSGDDIDDNDGDNSWLWNVGWSKKAILSIIFLLSRFPSLRICTTWRIHNIRITIMIMIIISKKFNSEPSPVRN